MYRNGIKRLLAVILSLCGMIVLSPLLVILCIAITLPLSWILSKIAEWISRELSKIIK